MISIITQFLFPPVAAPRRFSALEGLRGVAVTAVFLVHFVSLAHPHMGNSYNAFWKNVSDIGHSGVDIFFALSGFLIYFGLIKAPRPVLPYLARRIERIYPTYLFVLLIYVLLSYAVPSENKIPDGLQAAVIFIVKNIFLIPGDRLISVSWSLTYEIIFYLTVPLVIAVLRLRQWRPIFRVCLYILFVTCIYAFAEFASRLCVFIAGILAAEFYSIMHDKTAKSDKVEKFKVVAMDICTIIIVLISCAVMIMYNSATLPHTISIFCMCFALCALSVISNSFLATCLKATFIRYLGSISYSYYLIHGLVLKCIFFVLGRLVHGDIGVFSLMLLMVASYVVTVAVAVVIYRCVEWPLSVRPEERRLEAAERRQAHRSVVST